MFGFYIFNNVRIGFQTFASGLVFGLGTILYLLYNGVFIGATWSTDMRNRMLMSFAGYLVALAVFVPLFANHGLWLAMNGFLLVRGVFLAMLVRPRADQTFRIAQ